MKKIFECTYEIVDKDKLRVTATNLDTDVVKKEVVLIDEPELLRLVYNIIGSPLEEFEYGLYGVDASLKKILTDTIKQARHQRKIK